MFPAVIQAKDRAHGLLDFINRTGAHRAPGCAFLVREVDLETVGILVAHAGLGEILARPGTKTRQIPAEHVQLRLPLDDPLGTEQPQAPRLRKTRDDAVAAEIVAQFRHRAEQGAAVG